MTATKKAMSSTVNKPLVPPGQYRMARGELPTRVDVTPGETPREPPSTKSQIVKGLCAVLYGCCCCKDTAH